MVPALNAVLDAIARAVLGDAADDPVTVGRITLRAHQRDALRRIRRSIADCGGALLADEPGLGKTYVALALASEHQATVVVAPAALRHMWSEAAAAARATIAFVSIETLSRRDATQVPAGALVIVDEAHHACNPAAARYARLARLIAHRPVLLMSATPVRNRRAELGAMLALFMGPRARRLSEAALSRCIVRRAGDSALRPAIDGPHWHTVRATPGLAARIASLPPPLPALDGTEATALLSMSLARCWASSLAALDAALRRRLQRGSAMEALLADGVIPTRDELRSWVVGDDGVQLAFPMLAAHRATDAAALQAVLERHLCAARQLRERIRGGVRADTAARAALLLDLRRSHPLARVAAFTSHAATAEALYRALARERGVALLTARGARTAGGPRPREDVVRALGGGRPASVRDDISLVIATDLLSEGVNLQGVSVIVHLDVPWTPAGLDQRVGRAARMGSPHALVHVHGISPPHAAERLLALERRLRKKHGERLAAAGAPDQAERLRTIVGAWRREPARPYAEEPAEASVIAPRTAFLAVVDSGGGSELVGGVARGNGGWSVVDSPAMIARIADAAGTGQIETDERDAARARASIGRWLADRRARESSGAGLSPSPARRALLAALDAASRRTPSHVRAELGIRLANARERIARAVSAGAERTLRDLSESAPLELKELLAACEAVLAEVETRSAPGDGPPPGLRALLLLRRR